ncbi:MAG: IMPACT family protein [Planctomycetota bacterium]|nr:IMPACT family protein [Planctomycetota bacterium]MDG1983018.1 IMPACT family protein [Planctomycetota bacterium]
MSAAPDRFTTLAAGSRYEPDKIKGSRFIACVAPAATPDEAASFVQSVREDFSDARHVCFAWRLGAAGDETRSNDDGEPSGSAGRPILMQIEGHEVSNVVAAVVRYFGGVKLGVGGLMRAYGGAAGQALDRAELLQVEVEVGLRCVHPYGDSGAVQGVLAAWGLTAQDEEYGEAVSFSVYVGIRAAAAFETALRDATAARARSEPIKEA